MGRTLTAGALVLALLATSQTEAGPHLPLESRRADIRPNALAPLLRRGELALVEVTAEGTSKQIAVMTVVGVPPERVYDTILDVERYPEFLKGMKRTHITQKTPNVLGYEWVLDLPVFDLRGHRAMRGQRPRLVEVRGTAGHFRSSQDRWELYGVEGGERTLVVLYRALDFNDAGLILKTISELEPSMANALSLAMAFVQVRSLRSYLEGQKPPSYRRLEGPVPPLQHVPFGVDGVQKSAISPLLDRGLLALVESDAEGALRQATIWGRVEAPVANLRSVVMNASDYARFIPTFKETKLSRLGQDHFRLEWTLDVPLVSVSGVTDVFSRADGSIDMLAISGDVKRAHWRWSFEEEDNRALLVHEVYSDVREASWLVEKLVDREPLLEHGIVVAASAIGVQAIKARTEGKRPDSAPSSSP